MKKLLITLSLVTVIAFNAKAQFETGMSDGFFSSNYSEQRNEGTENMNFPLLPTHNKSEDQEAPVGSGLLILTSLGAFYALRKKEIRN